MKQASYTPTLALYFTALVLCMAARIWLKLFAMDLTTGFYTGSQALATAFHAVLAGSILLLLLLYLLRRPYGDYPVLTRSKALSVLALLCGVGILCYIVELLSPYRIGGQNPGVVLTGFAQGLCAVLGLAAGIAFLVLGAQGLFHRRGMHGGVLPLTAGIWLLVLLVCKFNSYTTLTTISDHLLAVLFMVFGAMFFVAHARTLSGLARKDGRNYVIPSGLCASLCGFLLCLPNWVWAAVNQTSSLPALLLGGFESIFVFFASVYAMAFSLYTVKSIKSV